MAREENPSRLRHNGGGRDESRDSFGLASLDKRKLCVKLDGRGGMCWSLELLLCANRIAQQVHRNDADLVVQVVVVDVVARNNEPHKARKGIHMY